MHQVVELEAKVAAKGQMGPAIPRRIFIHTPFGLQVSHYLFCLIHFFFNFLIFNFFLLGNADEERTWSAELGHSSTHVSFGDTLRHRAGIIVLPSHSAYRNTMLLRL